jgi:cytochrome P450
MVGSPPSVAFDPFDPAMLTDPCPAYAELRDAGPVVRLPAHDVWAVGRYDDVRAALRDYETFSSAGGIASPPARPGDAHAETGLVIRADPPLQTRMRRTVAPLFTTRALAEQERPLRLRITEVLDAVIGAGPVDVIGALADVVAVGTFADLVCRVGLDEAEAWSVLAGLSRAGMDTAADLIGTILHLLATRPEAWDALRACPQLAEVACEEALRFESPVPYLFRTTTRATVIGDTPVPAGSGVLLLHGAANRDPRHYRDADTFDVHRFDRQPVDHLAYGHGVHLCVGAPLARLEGRVLLEELLARVSAIEPAGEPERRRDRVTRGFTRLPLRILGR